MSYIHQVCIMADKLDEKMMVSWNEKSFKYTISIPNVLHRAQSDLYLRKPLIGLGFTIEDACYDMKRKCSGDYLIHTFSNKEIQIV